MQGRVQAQSSLWAWDDSGDSSYRLMVQQCGSSGVQEVEIAPRPCSGAIND